MANGIRTGDPRGFNKGHSSKFRVGSRVRQTPEEGRWTYRPNIVEITIKMKKIVRKHLMKKKSSSFVSEIQTTDNYFLSIKSEYDDISGSILFFIEMKV